MDAREDAGRAVEKQVVTTTLRWTEIGMNSLSNFLTGLTLLLYGAAVVLGGPYPRWAGWIAAVSGGVFVYNGVAEVAYEGFGPSIVKPVGILLWQSGLSSWPC